MGTQTSLHCWYDDGVMQSHSFLVTAQFPFPVRFQSFPRREDRSALFISFENLGYGLPTHKFWIGSGIGNGFLIQSNDALLIPGQPGKTQLNYLFDSDDMPGVVSGAGFHDVTGGDGLTVVEAWCNCGMQTERDTFA